MKVFLIGVLGLAVLAAVLVVGLRAMSPIQEAKNIQATTTTIQETTKTYAIKIDYPRFGISTIDAQIQSDIDAAVLEFKDLPPNPFDSATPQNSFDGSYEDVYIGPDIVSAKLILSQYTGGAHPMTILSGVNFDRETGERLLLTDILPMIGKSVQELSAEVTAHLRQKFGENFFPEGANTNPENFSSFVISESAVTFIFQPYQVAAYAAGPQEVSFPRVK